MVISRKREAFAAGPEADSAQNSMAAVSADGSTVWVLMQRLNSFSIPAPSVNSSLHSPHCVLHGGLILVALQQANSAC